MKPVIDTSLAYVYELARQAAKLEIESENYQIETKKTIWLKMGNELESKNYPKEEIYGLVHKYLQDEIRKLKKDDSIILNNGHLYDVCKKSGWTRTSDQKIENSSDLEPELFGECVGERLQYIKFMDDIIDRMRSNKDLLKESCYYDLDEKGNEIEIKLNWSGFFEREGKDEILNLMKDIFYNELKEWQQMVDTRQAIIPRMRFFIAAFLGVVTNQDFCDDYYSIVKSKMNVTPKKRTQFWNDVYTAGKTAGMDANSKPQLFDLYRQDAFQWHFIDIPCPDCKQKKMRIKLKDNGTWWFTCNNSEYHKIDEVLYPAALFGERIQQLSENRGGAGSSFLEKNGIQVKSY